MRRKLKEPVRLRAKKLANGNQSLYLDTYDKGKRKYEFLRLYLIPEKTAEDKILNKSTIRAATAIKSQRILALVNGKANIKPQNKSILISELIDKKLSTKNGVEAKSCISLLKRLKRHLYIYKGEIAVCDIDRDYCVGFVEYLSGAKALNSTKLLQEATQYELLNALSMVLNEAEREEIIISNPAKLLKSHERIKKPESTREYLTKEELRKIMAHAEKNIEEGDDIAAFLFCCFCGLRYSDVSALKWKDVMEYGDSREIKIKMKKTGRRIVVPLSENAAALLTERSVNPEDNVFSFPHYCVTLRRLKKLAKETGIEKKVTFHVSRHTFATMLLTAGADIYTISKLIGHSDIRTTQIYTKVIDNKKREAVSLLDKLF